MIDKLSNGYLILAALRAYRNHIQPRAAFERMLKSDVTP